MILQKQEIFKTANDGNNIASSIAMAMAANNFSILNSQKCAGDNKISFMLLVTQFKHSDGNSKQKNLLLCCTNSVAFGNVSDAINLNWHIIYAELEDVLRKKCCGTEYKRSRRNRSI